MSAQPPLGRRWFCTAAVLASLCIAAVAFADGGAVVCAQRVGDLRVTVLMSPARPLAGPVEFSVMVRDANGVQRSDIAVELEAEHPSSSRHLSSAATPEASRNPQLASTWLDLAQAGDWEISVHLEPSGDTISFSLQLATPAPGGIHWNWLWWAGIGLFVLVWREFLLRHQSRH